MSLQREDAVALQRDLFDALEQLFISRLDKLKKAMISRRFTANESENAART